MTTSWRWMSIPERICANLSPLLPGRRRVAVLVDSNAPPGTRRVVQRAAQIFSGAGGVTFEVLSRPLTNTDLRALYLRFGGLLVTGGYSKVWNLFPTRLLPAFGADPLTDPMAMWSWHSIIAAISPMTQTRLAESKERFTRLMRELAKLGLGRSYVFGTGPSLAKAAMRDFSDGYRIVCNTICKDRGLFVKLKPHILVAGDAQYHFSDTRHAQAFLRDVEERMEEVEFAFCYPAHFDAFVRRRFAKVEERLIPIPGGSRFDLAADMTREFALPSTGNVLGLLLLPIACQLSKDVWLLGFDGRRPSDKHFWANSSKHSYPALIEEMVLEYPAFYSHFAPKDNPSSYATSVHGDALDKALAHAEAAGWSFTLTSPSTSPALAKRWVINV